MYRCIGGVGVFLLETGLQVSRGLKEEGFQYDLSTLKYFFESPHAILIWTIPLLLAIVLRIITHFYHHQLIFPAYFFSIPVVFYIVVFAAGLDLDELRRTGWVMDVGGDTEAWWKFYTQFVRLLSCHFICRMELIKSNRTLARPIGVPSGRVCRLNSLSSFSVFYTYLSMCV